VEVVVFQGIQVDLHIHIIGLLGWILLNHVLQLESQHQSLHIPAADGAVNKVETDNKLSENSLNFMFPCIMR